MLTRCRTKPTRSWPTLLLNALVFGVCFVVNPAYFSGCITTSDNAPKFSEQDMRKRLDDANSEARFEFKSGGASYELELALKQKPGNDQDSTTGASVQPLLGQRAYACGNRTFLQSASACITITSMPVSGTATLRRTDAGNEAVVAKEFAVDGALTTYGATLDYLMIDLSFGKNGGDSMTLQSASGHAFEVSWFHGQGLGVGGTELKFSASQ